MDYISLNWKRHHWRWRWCKYCSYLQYFPNLFLRGGGGGGESSEILLCDPLKLMVGGCFPEHYWKIIMVFRTKVVFVSHKASLATVGTRLQMYHNVLKATRRETLQLENCSQKFLLLLSKGGILCCYCAILAIYFLSSLPGAVPQEARLEFTELGGCESKNLKIDRRNNKSFWEIDCDKWTIFTNSVFLQTLYFYTAVYEPLVWSFFLEGGY